MAKDEAAERLAELTPVTAEAVRLDWAFAPQTDIVHEVDWAAQESKWPTAYSPAARFDDAKVKGWILLPDQPCCNELAVPLVVVPEAHDTARDALINEAKEVLFPKL